MAWWRQRTATHAGTIAHDDRHHHHPSLLITATTAIFTAITTMTITVSRRMADTKICLPRLSIGG